jgi:hypothetical protein
MATDPLEARQARLGKNQALFRSVNEQIEYIAKEQTTVIPLDFLCECADPDCDTYIGLTQGEYEAIRQNPTRFFVLPDHVFPEVETIVDDRGRYVIVEKFGAGARVVEAIHEDAVLANVQEAEPGA